MTRYVFLFALAALVGMKSEAQTATSEYEQALRPQYHFSTSENYVGNPAAVVYADSLYHLYYEYSPVGTTPVYLNMGHAVSRDLLHWSQMPIALNPDDDTRDLYRCSVRSGSVLLDKSNVLGKQKTDTLTQVVYYTSYQCGIRMAYSTDGGKTWTKHETPLIPYVATEDARDPKVFRYEPGKNFVMLIARKQVGLGEGISFYTSTDLVNWEYQTHVAGPVGRPDFVELPVDGDYKNTRWVLTDSIGDYVIGNFDGKKFSAETDLMKGNYGFCTGAASWKVEEGESQRVLQIGLLGGDELKGTSFAGQLSFPAELTIQKLPEGLQLTKTPAREIAAIEDKPWLIENKNILPGLDKNPIKRMKGDRYRIRGTFQLKTVNSFGFVLRSTKGNDGTEVRYDATRNQLSCLGKTAPLMPEDGKIQFDILVDRSSVEVYANGGKVVISGQLAPEANALDYILYNTGGELFIEKLEVCELKSVYPK